MTARTSEPAAKASCTSVTILLLPHCRSLHHSGRWERRRNIGLFPRCERNIGLFPPAASDSQPPCQGSAVLPFPGKGMSNCGEIKSKWKGGEISCLEIRSSSCCLEPGECQGNSTVPSLSYQHPIQHHSTDRPMLQGSRVLNLMSGT